VELLTIFIIAFGLAMDSFAVSVTCGVIHKRVIIKHFFTTAIYMGLFQGGMTLLGYYFGLGFKKNIEVWDHWIAFGVLSFLGIKMILEGRKKEEKKVFCPTKTNVKIGLAIATSIDALAVGVSLAFLVETPFLPSTIIALMAFILSLLGIFLGAKFSESRKLPLEILGGLTLIFIGIKILIEHTLLH
jgi:manganese efflux pump family protein